MPSSPSPPRRVIGRILSLGFPLPGVRVDNYNFCSAPSFFDYDALVVDPSSLSRLIEDVVAGSAEVQAFSGKSVLNVPEQPDEVALSDILLRRVDETRALLERGGVIVCFAHPPTVHRGVRGIEEMDDYYWLGDHAPSLVSADGTQVEVVDYQHPMASFLLSQQANVAYRAHTCGEVNVFARSYGGAAVAADLEAQRGRIVMLPALKAIPSGEARYAMSESLQAAIRRMLGVVGEGRAPGWVAAYSLPGLDERAARRDEAKKALEGAAAALGAAEHEHEELARYQRLLWQEGMIGIEDVVLDALKLIGFDVYASDPNALELRHGDTNVLLEIDASDGAVGLAAHYRLRQRIERAIEQRGTAPRGVIVINGFRLHPPEERKQQASEALRTAAETMRYAIAPTTGLFRAVVAQLSGDEGAVAAYREALVASVGVITSEQASE